VPSSYTGHDAGVLELAADLGLLDEALHDLGPVREALDPAP
jgi:hypothetical protein